MTARAQSGGFLAYLHGGKPFLRGGDFTARQAAGQRPMQLNYSRAFGGKDLKMYGLSPVPEVSQQALTGKERVIVLASDGLWDVASAEFAVRRAIGAAGEGRDPASDLASFALREHDVRARTRGRGWARARAEIAG